MLLRGYGGYNTRWALFLLHHIFPLVNNLIVYLFLYFGWFVIDTDYLLLLQNFNFSCVTPTGFIEFCYLVVVLAGQFKPASGYNNFLWG